MLLDAETGQVLSEQNADVLTYPASLTKMMTLYLTFEALNQGRVRTRPALYGFRRGGEPLAEQARADARRGDPAARPDPRTCHPIG